MLPNKWITCLGMAQVAHKFKGRDRFGIQIPNVNLACHKNSIYQDLIDLKREWRIMLFITFMGWWMLDNMHY